MSGLFSIVLLPRFSWYYSLITGLGGAVISMRYPKVDGAEGRKYDRVYVVPLEVDNEKYPVDLDGRRPNLGKRHSHRGKSKVGIRLSNCAWGKEISQEVLLQSLIHQTETPGQFLTASSAWCRLSRFPSDLSFFNLLFCQRFIYNDEITGAGQEAKTRPSCCQVSDNRKKCQFV